MKGGRAKGCTSSPSLLWRTPRFTTQTAEVCCWSAQEQETSLARSDIRQSHAAEPCSTSCVGVLQRDGLAKLWLHKPFSSGCYPPFGLSSCGSWFDGGECWASLVSQVSLSFHLSHRATNCRSSNAFCSDHSQEQGTTFTTNVCRDRGTSTRT